MKSCFPGCHHSQWLIIVIEASAEMWEFWAFFLKVSETVCHYYCVHIFYGKIHKTLFGAPPEGQDKLHIWCCTRIAKSWKCSMIYKQCGAGFCRRIRIVRHRVDDDDGYSNSASGHLPLCVSTQSRAHFKNKISSSRPNDRPTLWNPDDARRLVHSCIRKWINWNCGEWHDFDIIVYGYCCFLYTLPIRSSIEPLHSIIIFVCKSRTIMGLFVYNLFSQGLRLWLCKCPQMIVRVLTDWGGSSRVHNFGAMRDDLLVDEWRGVNQRSLVVQNWGRVMEDWGSVMEDWGSVMNDWSSMVYRWSALGYNGVESVHGIGGVVYCSDRAVRFDKRVLA